jgi:spore germination cell wall hydrolase CwlJ-like protein
MTRPLADLCLHERRPPDFTARIAHARRSASSRIARLALLIAGVVALPAFAAPGEWSPFSIGDATHETTQVEPMPFERAGDSFPGSAFYYLQFDNREPGFGEGIHSDAQAAIGSDVIATPMARAMRIDNSGVDRTRAEQCLTAAIYYEAASEPDSGQRAVAQVVLNRVAHPAYPKTVCGVVYQGSERSTGCQFSFACDGALARRPNRLFWDRAADVARAALAGYVYAPAGLATHYHTVAVHPYWAPSLHYMLTIGAHRFYSFNGRAGQPAVFHYAYLGGEPMPTAHRHDDSAPSAAVAAAVDPLAIQKAYDEGLQRARAQGLIANPGGLSLTAAPAPAPVYTSELKDRGGDTLYQARTLPGANTVREEYRNSGQWIASPTG